jgi:hypothetical protein
MLNFENVCVSDYMDGICTYSYFCGFALIFFSLMKTSNSIFSNHGMNANERVIFMYAIECLE